MMFNWYLKQNQSSYIVYPNKSSKQFEIQNLYMKISTLK